MYKFNASCIASPIDRHCDLSHSILSLPNIVERLCNMSINLDFMCHPINWLGQSLLHFSAAKPLKSIYKNTCNNIATIRACIDHSNTTLSQLEGNNNMLDIMKLPSSICSHDNNIADNSTIQEMIEWQCEVLPIFDHHEETKLQNLSSVQSIQQQLCAKAIKASYNCTISNAGHIYNERWLVEDRSNGGNMCSDSYDEYERCNVHSLRKYLANATLSTVYSVLQDIQEFCNNTTGDDTIRNNNGTIPSDETTPHNSGWLWFIIPAVSVPIVAVSTALLIKKYCHKQPTILLNGIIINKPTNNGIIEYGDQQYSVREILLNGVNSRTLLPDEDALQPEQPNQPHVYVNMPNAYEEHIYDVPNLIGENVN